MFAVGTERCWEPASLIQTLQATRSSETHLEEEMCCCVIWVNCPFNATALQQCERRGRRLLAAAGRTVCEPPSSSSPSLCAEEHKPLPTCPPAHVRRQTSTNIFSFTLFLSSPGRYVLSFSGSIWFLQRGKESASSTTAFNLGTDPPPQIYPPMFGAAPGRDTIFIFLLDSLWWFVCLSLFLFDTILNPCCF